MKIGMLTWGSHGDIRPFLALAEGLQEAGNAVHLVIVCVDSDVYKGYVSRCGATVSVLASPVLTPAQHAEHGRIAYRTRDPMKQLARILRSCLAPVEDLLFDAARRLADESDILIGHYFMHPLQIAAEAASLPYVSVQLSPIGIPSAFTNPFGGPSLGTALNRLSWHLVRGLLNRVLLPYSNRLRSQAGLAPVRDAMTEVWLSKQLTLAAISPQLCHAQPDWPASLQVCGFLDTEHLAIEGRLPEALAAFLDAGEAPVYMSFGSWMAKDRDGQARDLQLLTQAARRAGCRAIIQSDSARECGFASDAQILYVGAAPHHAIFPHCRAIVHHGGAGTTQSATLAGKPSIVVANLGEQEHWAGQLRRLGIGARLARRRSVTAAGLAERIGQVLASPDMGAKAEAIAAAMRTENGVATAVAAIMRRFGG